MSNAISGSGLGPSPAVAPLRAKWGWIVALGAVYVVAGVVALGSVVSATAATVLIVGAMMIVSGVAEVINALQVKTWGRFLFWLALGILAGGLWTATKLDVADSALHAPSASFGGEEFLSRVL